VQRLAHFFRFTHSPNSFGFQCHTLTVTHLHTTSPTIHQPLRNKPTHSRITDSLLQAQWLPFAYQLFLTHHVSVNTQTPTNPATRQHNHSLQISNPLTQQRPAHAFINEPTFLRTGHTRLLTFPYPRSLWHSTSPFTRAHTQRGEGGVQEVLGFSPPNANRKHRFYRHDYIIFFTFTFSQNQPPQSAEDYYMGIV